MSLIDKTLREVIEQEILERGPIPFSRYMEMCLYHRELGYYSRNVEQFGMAGDFFTASDVHAVFGRLLARQFEEMWRVLGSPPQIEILELGPGRGLFARDVLDWSQKKFPTFFAALHYSLRERSPWLRRRLQETLREHIERGKASLAPPADPPPVCHSERSRSRTAPEQKETGEHITSGAEASPTSGAKTSLTPQHSSQRSKRGATQDRSSFAVTCGVPEESVIPRALATEVPTIVIANEFFDALPCEMASANGELRIAIESGRLAETWAHPSTELLEFLDRHSVHPEPGERIEVPLAAQACMKQIASAIERGFVVAIDYGYTRAEQLAGRHRGTLMTYRQHSAASDPYQSPGEQDITAHVNFSALAAAVEQGGMTAQPLVTQSQFLLGIGEQTQFADAFEECRLPQEKAKVALQLKHLITPAGVGETFHVMVASNGVEAIQASQLSGLSFGKARR